MLVLICGDVIRPSLGWLLTPATVKNLAVEIARARDPDGFAALAAACPGNLVNAHTTRLALRRIATILAAAGAPPPGIDSLHLPADVASTWKQRITTKTTRNKAADGQILTGGSIPRQHRERWRVSIFTGNGIPERDVPRLEGAHPAADSRAPQRCPR